MTNDAKYPCPLGRPCGTHGDKKTYASQVTLRLNGRDRGIDPCVAPIVEALHEGGLQPVASCCGHGVMPASVLLEDGRQVLIVGREEGDTILGSARAKNQQWFEDEIRREAHARGLEEAAGMATEWAQRESAAHAAAAEEFRRGLCCDIRATAYERIATQFHARAEAVRKGES